MMASALVDHPFLSLAIGAVACVLSFIWRSRIRRGWQRRLIGFAALGLFAFVLIWGGFLVVFIWSMMT
jgi:hypothetical protein